MSMLRLPAACSSRAFEPILPQALLADAASLTRFDSSALAVLLDCRREALALGKTFSVKALPPRLRVLAGLYGVAELLPAAP